VLYKMGEIIFQILAFSIKFLEKKVTNLKYKKESRAHAAEMLRSANVYKF
jgi:hypothetical protein